MNQSSIIVGSVLSEKSVSLTNVNIYTLKVGLNSTKQEIKKTLKEVFNVDTISINTCITRGKTSKKTRHKNGGMVFVKSPNFKKAYVRLKEGQTLPTPSNNSN